MLRALVAVDGSDHSSRVLQHVARLKGEVKDKLEVLLLNVQPPVPMADLLLGGRLSEVHQLEQPLREEGMRLLGPAQAELAAAGIEARPHVEFGEPAEVIGSFAGTHHCELIVMGSRGAGAIASIVLGSVAIKVLHLSPVPVLLVP